LKHADRGVPVIRLNPVDNIASECAAVIRLYASPCRSGFNLTNRGRQRGFVGRDSSRRRGFHGPGCRDESRPTSDALAFPCSHMYQTTCNTAQG